MSLLYRIVYAAHANGTHHKLALDALSMVEGADAERWQNLFLKYAKTYLDGSKAPDNTFKDFKNHVLHVRDDYWGGAPEKADEWYATLLVKLRAGAWEEAVYAAGVLSHYFTDPFHPFHTGQTEAENAIHRACEWSINRSYDSLAALGRERFAGSAIAVPNGAQWLRDFVCLGAETSNKQYEKLMAHYDIHRGVADPPAGLDDTARSLVAELIVQASNGFSRVLERAFAESGVAAPDVSLTAEAFLAALQMPVKFIEKKLTNAADRTQVLAMYHELQTTGRVEATLSEDDRTVRELHAKEVLEPQKARQATARAKRLAKREAPQQAVAQQVPRQPVATAPRPQVAPQPAPAATPRAFLKASDDVEAAPSIGARTAQKLAEAGIFTVADLIAADPASASATLGALRISTDTLRLWQDQARLVMDVPGLRGTHAQLLTGAGYHDVAAVAAADAGALCAAVLRFATTSEGQRVLRQDGPPPEEKIKSWVASAAAARSAA
jgi:predicted flap endonuclease-1-like 5' DNA nuclease